MLQEWAGRGGSRNCLKVSVSGLGGLCVERIDVRLVKSPGHSSVWCVTRGGLRGVAHREVRVPWKSDETLG